MHVCNRETFGYIPDLTTEHQSADDQAESFTHLRIQHLLNGQNKTYAQPLPKTKYLETGKKLKRTRLGFDQIYVINLERRKDRRDRIESTLNDLNLDYQIRNAVDVKKIDDDYVLGLGIKPLPFYKDPYNDRPLNLGEIGCFLSHFFIWKDVICF